MLTSAPYLTLRRHQAVKSKIAYATDTWSTKQMIFTFAADKGFFIDDEWDLCELLIDFKVLQDDEHKGQEAAKSFVASGAKRGGLDKMSVTLDAFTIPVYVHFDLRYLF